MVPPLPPILMYTDPPRPDSALPVPIYKAPLMPAVVAPVLMMSWPLTPAVPEFGVRNARFPLEYSVPIPEIMLTAPPDNVDELPPLSWHRKRQSPPPEAMPCGTIYKKTSDKASSLVGTRWFCSAFRGPKMALSDFNLIRIRIFLDLHLVVEVIFTSLYFTSFTLKSVALFVIIIFRLFLLLVLTSRNEIFSN